MLKILQARLQQYMNWERPDVQAGFTKGSGTRDQIAYIHWIIEKTRVSEKHLLLLHWLCQSLCVYHNKLENSSRDRNTKKKKKERERWEYQTTWPASWETCMQVKKQYLELDMEQQTGSK